MGDYKIDLAEKIVYIGNKKYWYEHAHDAAGEQIRVWFRESKTSGYIVDVDGEKEDERTPIAEIKKRQEARRDHDGPITWVPAERRVKDHKKTKLLNAIVDLARRKQRDRKKENETIQKPVDRAEKEQRTQEAKEDKVHSRPEGEGDRSMKPPSFELVSKNRLKSGKFIWHRKKDGTWIRIKNLDSKYGEFVSKEGCDTLDRIFSELAGPIRDKNPSTSSRRKRPNFAERNKHGGLIVHGLANGSYYTRFDIGKSRKYPRGFTFRMGRGKFFIQETMDKQSLAAIEKEISWALRS